MDQYESDLQAIVHSFLLFMHNRDLHFVKFGRCSANCIHYYLVKLLKSSSYDVAVCGFKWQGHNQVPGGMFCLPYFYLITGGAPDPNNESFLPGASYDY